MIKASKEDKVVIKRISYIHYPLRFHKDKENELQALINLGNKVNAITPAYAAMLSLKVR